ncbi:DUF3147 family protein [Methylobacter tundripaludum]|uniref:DUF3147 family protein n=1 Tax=Methylobacter tundripaludum (strain ATCC BAA-1195 / DSM 17260 / SV96) TaxID=697282 RepID=G3IXC1_METTV|nr:DUF3147 family protein [Methylobacter tundripaludum]EGW23178.1 hypothetical protein Mettu_2021 [Methylobacter tundripaludum SV96]
MIYTIIKVIATSLLIVAISELSKRSSLIGALFASMPLISVLAILWLYIDTKDVAKVSDLATGVFWLVIPSLAFFVSLPILLKNGVNFYLSLGLSMSVTAGCYFLMTQILMRYGIKL